MLPGCVFVPPTHSIMISRSIINIFTVRHSCRDPSCAEYLSNTSLQSFATCFNKTWSGELDEKYIHRGCCHFMSGEKRQTVLLASYPGSGNTWARGLLESTTGICTGIQLLCVWVCMCEWRDSCPYITLQTFSMPYTTTWVYILNITQVLSTATGQ